MSTRFNTVHPGRAPLPGPPRFTTVVFDMSKTTGKTPGSSRSIRHDPGPSRWTTVQPPVLPGSPRSMDRGEPGSTGSPVGLGHYVKIEPWQTPFCSVGLNVRGRGRPGAIVIFFTYLLITSSMYFINYLFVPHSPATHVVYTNDCI